MVSEKDSSSNKRKETVSPAESDIIVYGTSWCGKTQMIRRYLESVSLPYKYLDLENDPGAVNQLRWITGGSAHHPTVVIDGQALIETDVSELSATLSGSGYI